MKIASWIVRGMLVVGATALVACSSSNNNSTGKGGTTGSAGSTGAAGTGGSAGSAGTGGSGGVAGTGGSAAGGSAGSAGGTGGSAGAGGSAGTAGAAGAAGSAGAGGAGGMACVGDPPVTEHNMCTAIASGKKGDAAFTISSPDFTNCSPLPTAQTCDGRAFGTGASPSLMWSGAPSGTMSFALVFKDISILADNNPMTERLGYHWVMWDIPASRTSLPAALTGGYHSAEVTGALQWSGRNNYAFFPSCPNPFPRDDARFMCSLVIDSYSFTLYALPSAKLTNLPPPDIDAATGQPTGNYVVKLAKYIDSLSALAVTEYRATSKAWSTSFAPPAPVQYPCSAIAAVDGGVPAADGGAPDGGADGGTSTCLQ